MKKEIKKYSLIGLTIILLILAYLIVEPFISAILTSAILAYIFYPLYKKTVKIFKSKLLSSTLITLLIVLIFIAPITIIIQKLIQETIALYNIDTLNAINNFLAGTKLSSDAFTSTINQMIGAVLASIAKVSSNYILSIPEKILQFLIMAFTTGFLLINGKKITAEIKKHLPLKNKNELIKQIELTIHSIIYGFFVVGLIGFIIALIGFYIMGLPSPIFWSIIIGIAVIIPIIGPTVIWVPYAIIKFVQQDYQTAIGLIIIGGIISLMETVLRPILISKKAKVNILAIFIGVFGGIMLFGIPGIILGPIILSTTLTVIKTILKESETK